MTRDEALFFLELPATASVYEIKQRLCEKLAYYENMSENAPSDFLRRLNARHVIKVQDIQREFPEWDPSRQELSVEFPVDEADEALAKAEEDAGPLTIPIIVGPGGKLSGMQKKQLIDPPGWLIRHTENQSSKTFTLARGKNYIGRKADPLLTSFIVIEDDTFISKVHAVLSVEENNDVTEFFLMDTPASNGGKASSNGTYLNGNPNRISEKIKLFENDTIQVGITKLILKVNNNKIQEIVQEVKRSKFMHTVVFNKP